MWEILSHQKQSQLEESIQDPFSGDFLLNNGHFQNLQRKPNKMIIYQMKDVSLKDELK